MSKEEKRLETYDASDYNEIVANGMLEIEESDGLACLVFYRESPSRDSLVPSRLAKIVARITLPVGRLASVERRFMTRGVPVSDNPERLAEVEAAGTA